MKKSPYVGAKALGVVVCLTALTVLVSCGPKDGSTPQRDNVLHVGKDISTLGNMDVMLTSQSAPFEISDTITDTLVGKREEDLALYPLLLADFPSISEDGLTYTFTLKKGVLFHDGTELKADDVIYTFNRFFNPATQANMVWLCDEVIKGAMDVEKGLA
ncbi:MAG: ABC transporter substrate-binding protein, partial [Spirochaetaceae bacterium]|nr:ABC transporter substrate-binding protein [Spirochaetaceae bacterium]